MRQAQSTCKRIVCIIIFNLSLSHSHIYQAWGAGRSIISQEDKNEVCFLSISSFLTCQTECAVKQLKNARKEGRLSEALLDRRMKLKRYGFACLWFKDRCSKILTHISLLATDSAKSRTSWYVMLLHISSRFVISLKGNADNWQFRNAVFSKYLVWILYNPIHL